MTVKMWSFPTPRKLLISCKNQEQNFSFNFAPSSPMESMRTFQSTKLLMFFCCHFSTNGIYRSSPALCFQWFETSNNPLFFNLLSRRANMWNVSHQSFAHCGNWTRLVKPNFHDVKLYSTTQAHIVSSSWNWTGINCWVQPNFNNN